MKHPSQVLQSIIALLVVLATLALASTNSPALAAPVSQIDQLCLAGGSATAETHVQTGKLRFLAAAEPGRTIAQPRALEAGASPETASRNFLAVCGPQFGIHDEASELSLMRVRPQDDETTMVRFQQLHNNIPVIAGELISNVAHTGEIVSISGEISPDLDLDTTPTISPADAQQVARQRIARKHNLDANALTTTEPQLWIYDPQLLRTEGGFRRLVWRMNVSPGGLSDINELVLVDAHAGVVALSFNEVPHAKNRETYTTFNTTNLPGTFICNESNPTCSNGDADAQAAHIFAGDVYDYYKNNHARDSLNNAGITIRSTVHYGTQANAFFINQLSQMVYFDGFSRADDVVGHELTHGVTFYESGLFYYYQSGAINESLSDVFGEFIDLTNGKGSDGANLRWTMGEDLPPGSPQRSMSNPPAFNHPDKITSALYYSGSCIDFSKLGQCDNGGVHINSGVNNKAAFLMVDGGTFNGKTITGMGIAKVSKIYYRAQSTLLTSGSDYMDLYNALFQACQQLIGTSGITGADCTEVREATQATEMDKQPSAGYNPDAPFCSTGQSPANVFFDNLDANANNWQTGWFAGANQWFYGSTAGPFAHSGTGFLHGNATQSLGDDTFAQMKNGVTLPANAFLWFAHAHGFENPNWDGGVVEYTTNNGGTWNDAKNLFNFNGYNGTIAAGQGNPLGGRDGFIGDSHGYISSRLNLASLAGQSVRFRWRMGTDNLGTDYGWWLDDVRIYTCSNAATATPTRTNTSVAPTPTRTNTPQGPSGTVKINSVWTANNKNVPKTTFKAGTKVKYFANIQNTAGAICNSTSTWTAKGSGATIMKFKGVVEIDPGTWNYWLTSKIPTTAPQGDYLFKVVVDCNGVKTSKKTNFTVNGVKAVNSSDSPSPSGPPRREPH